MRQTQRTGRGALVVVTGGNHTRWEEGPPMFDMTRMRRAWAAFSSALPRLH